MTMLAIDEEVCSSVQVGHVSQGCRILIVEDDAAFADVLDTTLRSRGYHVLRAGTVAEARAARASAGPVDLVLTDQRLPQELGYHLLYEQDLIWANTPILVMTAFPSDKLRRFLASQGVPLLEKPFSMERLVATVLAVLVLHVNDPDASFMLRGPGAA